MAEWDFFRLEELRGKEFIEDFDPLPNTPKQ
jgi:hypothetical protein